MFEIKLETHISAMRRERECEQVMWAKDSAQIELI